METFAIMSSYLLYKVYKMRKITNKDIGDYIGKSEQTVRGWGVKFPKLYEVVKLGAYCILNGLDYSDIEALFEFKKRLEKSSK